MPTYDIFSGLREHGPIWLESIDGLEQACARMRDRATLKPGAYFVYCSQTNAVLASVDTSKSVPAVSPGNRSDALHRYVHTLLFACPDCNLPIVIGRLSVDKNGENNEALLIKCSYCGKSFKVPSQHARRRYVEEWPDAVAASSRTAHTNSD
jgi:transcription elongation factor Elf1